MYETIKNESVEIFEFYVSGVEIVTAVKEKYYDVKEQIVVSIHLDNTIIEAKLLVIKT